MVSLYSLARPLIWWLNPEHAHQLALTALAAGLIPPARQPILPRLRTEVCGLHFDNPVGLAAGFDKNAEVADRMLEQGFGFVEVGSVTPHPQTGNPKPRLFRLEEDRAIINRLGFNNQGVDAIRKRLRARPLNAPGVVGVNLGANRDSSDTIADYVSGFIGLYGDADYFVVNVSSPNTPGLRDLQVRAALDGLISRLLDTRSRLAADGRPTPVLVKISPDLDLTGRQDVAAVVLSRGVDGLIMSNTTIGGRDPLHGPHAKEKGGLSGAPLFELSTDLLREMYQLTEGRVPLIGVGGVASGEQAYRKIRSGASLVQLFSALIYEGPRLACRINLELEKLLEQDGFAHVAEAVGVDVD